MFKRNLPKAALVLSGLAVAAGLALPPSAAQARVVVGVGVPWVEPVPYYYPPAPYYAPYYAPAPVYVPPPVYAPAPQPTYVAPAAQSQNWYYCDNPKGYYPYVQNCTSGWRQVPASPGGAPPQ
ncbi:MAG TPA: hypothetical protein VN832_03365 [Stellaceae bacterium]|nr:hypothetical protein [Stellaceae bacterium]